MSFYAELSIEGTLYPIRQLALELEQTLDAVGRPASVTRGGTIRLELDVVDDDALSEWMADPHKQLDGHIRYLRTDEEATLKEVRFSKAYCVDYLERFDGTQSDTPMTTLITISAQELTLGQVTVSNNWP